MESANESILFLTIRNCMLLIAWILASAAGFLVLDNTNYTDIQAIGHGSIKTNFIPARTCEPLTWKNGEVVLPKKSDWLNLINEYDPTPSDSSGFLVLDCEKLYLNGNTDQIKKNFGILKQLQEWTRTIRPNRVLGWYGISNVAYLSSIDPGYSYQALADLIDLDHGNTAYFPSEYTKTSYESPYLSNTNWEVAVRKDYYHIQKIEKLSRTGPHDVIPYIWPQYYDNAKELIPVNGWTNILNVLLRTGYNGTIIWGGQNPVENYNDKNEGSGPWLSATRKFLDLHSSS